MEVELAGSDGDSDDAIDWEADASESDDEAPAPRPPDAHPRAPEAPEDAAPPPKRRKVSYREAQAAKQRREARVGRDAAAAAVDAGAAFAPVVVGFERKRGDPKPKPKVDGVLVAAAHGDAVRARADARAADREARGKATRAKKVGARWAAIARTLLSREKLRASYGA